MRRRFLIGLVALISPIVVLLALAETALRLLPVSSGRLAVPVTTESPVFHFTPNRNFVFSRDWDLALVNHGRINNAGWINDQDYRDSPDRLLLAVIGDSYIEASMVPYADTLHGRLAKEYAGSLDVYSFGAAGAPLSQYLIWAQHAAQRYGAQALVINVVGNDFDESHSAYKKSDGFWHYVPGEDGALRLKLREFRPSGLGSVALHSALARYLLFNLRVLSYRDNVRRLYKRIIGAEQHHFAGNTAKALDPERVRLSLAVIDAFFRDLPERIGLPPERVLFTVDGFRYPEVAARNADSYFALMRRAFLAKAEAHGYETLDLDRWFFPLHRERGARFEFPRDGHWNATGHAVAAEAVRVSKLLARLTSASAVVK